jgi:haloalkane dehalogenase
VFVERALPARSAHTQRRDGRYRPFAEPGEGRRPTLTWPRQIPIDGEPAEVDAIVRAYSEWIATSPLPKLFIRVNLVRF